MQIVLIFWALLDVKKRNCAVKAEILREYLTMYESNVEVSSLTEPAWARRMAISCSHRFRTSGMCNGSRASGARLRNGCGSRVAATGYRLVCLGAGRIRHLSS